MDERTLLEALEERGLIEQVMKSLNLSRGSEQAAELSPRAREERVSEEERETEDENKDEMEQPRNIHQRLISPDGMKLSKCTSC